MSPYYLLVPTTGPEVCVASVFCPQRNLHTFAATELSLNLTEFLTTVLGELQWAQVYCYTYVGHFGKSYRDKLFYLPFDQLGELPWAQASSPW